MTKLFFKFNNIKVNIYAWILKYPNFNVSYVINFMKFCKCEIVKLFEINYEHLFYLENCCLCASTSLESSESLSSRAQSSNFSIHFRSADNFPLPASFNVSNSVIGPRNAKIS